MIKEITKEDIGRNSNKKIYHPNKVSIHFYKKGFMIKPYGQSKVYITKEQGNKLAKIIRTKRWLYTKKESDKLFSKEIALKI